ncbi:G2 M phase-specific E3 ubiquitin- ligase-like [Paramuricea clavata]|uniref:G2 M phase-specific E3 ubiquitin- ligase-like n=1 Tax=Paramuricea clavata TaxID=317549 RepID=A0A7D9LJ50_PARCT|nr:G2 M phase-specific E3 ubiquitin- ligase-like [Paramuricea clavata]
MEVLVLGCLSPSLYQCIVEGPNNVLVNASDVYDVELRSSLEKLLNAKSTDEANTMIDRPLLSTLLDLAGTFKFVSSLDEIPTLVQQTVKWFLLGRSHFSQEQFVQGLSVLGIYDSILKSPESFRPVFCCSPQQLNAEVISHLFETNFSEVGSNRHCSESLVISHWNDYLLDVEERAETEVTFNDILFFASGCKIIPPFGIKLSLEFLHHAEKNGEMSKFPKANTCACILYLLVTHSSYDKFKKALSFAFLNTRGFGEP